MKLNLGCGEDYKEGYVNVDNNTDYKADKYFNLNIISYPFEDNEFDKVIMNMILEHLNNPIEVLKEVSRICVDGAIIEVIVPHATTYSNFGDMQHKHFFTEKSFNNNLLIEYNLKELELISHEFIYTNKWKKYIPFKHYIKIFLTGIYDDMLFKFKVVKTSQSVQKEKENKKNE